jgi:cardiolipin synthase
MGLYRARDLLLVPSLLSLARLPLALAFVLLVRQPALAFVVLCLAGLSDVLDGWYARRFDQVTHTGTVVDPVTDKAFVLAVVITLVAYGHLSIWSVVLLSTREIGELPLVIWLGLSRRARRHRKQHPSANATGKLATAMQFSAVAAALFYSRYAAPLVWTTAAVGALAAVVYWRRALKIGRATG